MGVVAIIFVICTILAIEDGGDMTVTVLFAGLAVLFIYLWATKDKRAKKRVEETRKRKEEEECQRKAKLQQYACRRFNTAPFATQLRQDFHKRNWKDLDYNSGGCAIYEDRIITHCQAYIYLDHGWGNLDLPSCETLAEYFGLASGKEYVTEKITKTIGGVSSSYSGYISNDGSVSLSRDFWGEDITIGYKVYIKPSVPPPKPQGKAW